MPLSVIFLIPTYNDWDSVRLLLCDLDAVLRSANLSVEVLLVDDGSTLPLPDAPFAALPGIRALDILALRRNLGHQRAIAVGLTFVHSSRHCDVVVIMDGDGEDKPSDVVRLLDEFEDHHRTKIVFAERTRRSEGLIFSSFYCLYRGLHKLLTGFSVRVGNFSVLPYAALDTLVVVSELWNHYAAGVFKSRLTYTTIRTERGTRLAGRSHMQFASLVAHGLSALSVFGELIGVRILAATTTLALTLTFGFVLTVLIRFATPLAIPGWATYTTGLLFVILLQVAVIALLFVFVIMAGRINLSFIPLRDYRLFIKCVTRVFPRAT